LRLQHRKDATHDLFTQMLERQGWMMFDTHNLSSFVDAIGVKQESDRTRVVFFEFKSEYATKARREKHAGLHARLRRAGAEVVMLESVADVETWAA